MARRTNYGFEKKQRELRKKKKKQDKAERREGTDSATPDEAVDDTASKPEALDRD